MKHVATSTFWESYYALSPTIQRLADQAYERLKADPLYPSLRFKKVGRYWSARVGNHHRAVAVEVDGVFVWFWIGTHAEYDKLVR